MQATFNGCGDLNLIEFDLAGVYDLHSNLAPGYLTVPCIQSI